SDEFFKDIKEYFNAKKKSLESDSLRIRNLDFAKNTLSPTLIKLVESLLGAKKRAKNKEDEIEISAHIRKINALNNSIDVILNQALDNYVYWIESSRNRRSNNISINAAPINIGEILRSRLFASSTPIILTSATLSINDGSFKYFKDRVGIKEARELQLGSPFDYRNQVRMYIARNMPLPNNFTEYASQAAEKIKRYIKLTNGNAFVLFTSYSLMNSVYEDLEDYFIEEGINVLKQGSGIGRSKMLENFKKESGSVLFGVDSFWQGIDVQGESLSNVIITKLPFAVPDHPIIQSRIEEIEKGGGDAFLEYNLPEAILRFKQGFGRLIRSKKDTGIIVILDSRVLKKSYGRQFLNSIPKCEVFIDN
ncbi:MAG: helicase C-terminal domain-containing protein, partial [Candidatus Omnitrophota bacterium]|nr:helicase C-terminal domain-containing protein [Candidatus Omnitrophota bacterium]